MTATWTKGTFSGTNVTCTDDNSTSAITVAKSNGTTTYTVTFKVTDWNPSVAKTTWSDAKLALANVAN